MSEILDPISNKQRLEILKAVAFEPKSFSAFSKLTGLIAGNLLFHLQKLMDCELILQQHDRGDYMITEKGFKILQSLNEMCFSLQYFPQQIYHSNLFEESKKEELTDESKMVELTEALKQMALTRGASKVGIATIKTLLGGPPSADLTYVLPEAKSAVCFALAFDQNLIDPFFRKVDQESLETNKVRTHSLADGIALEIANFLQQSGYKAVPQPANFVYRRDTRKLAAGYASSYFPQVSGSTLWDRPFWIFREYYYKGIWIRDCLGLGRYGCGTYPNRLFARRRKLL